MTIYAAPDRVPIRYYKGDECHLIRFNYPLDAIDIISARFCVAEQRGAAPFIIITENVGDPFDQFQFSGNSGTLQILETDTAGQDPGNYVYDIVLETATVRCPAITGCFTLIEGVCP